jgi:N-methylhydantoinase B
VADAYVTVERARKDYGVVVREVDAELSQYEVDEEETARERGRIAADRLGRLEEEPELVAERYRSGELDVLDLVRHYGVILDWGTGELLPKTTEQFRAMLGRRMVPHWSRAAAPVAAGS